MFTWHEKMQNVCIAVMLLMLSIRHHLNQGGSVHLLVSANVSSFVVACMQGEQGVLAEQGSVSPLWGATRRASFPSLRKGLVSSLSALEPPSLQTWPRLQVCDLHLTSTFNSVILIFQSEFTRLMYGQRDTQRQ